MPHANTQSSKATAQNSATDPAAPSDQAREQNRSAKPEPRSYAAADLKDASLAPPAAGEVANYMAEGEALGAEGLQEGRNHTARPVRAEAQRGQDPRTRAANRAQLKSS
jgi:hypothetical protein